MPTSRSKTRKASCFTLLAVTIIVLSGSKGQLPDPKDTVTDENNPFLNPLSNPDSKEEQKAANDESVQEKTTKPENTDTQKEKGTFLIPGKDDKHPDPQNGKTSQNEDKTGSNPDQIGSNDPPSDTKTTVNQPTNDTNKSDLLNLQDKLKEIDQQAAKNQANTQNENEPNKDSTTKPTQDSTRTNNKSPNPDNKSLYENEAKTNDAKEADLLLDNERDKEAEQKDEKQKQKSNDLAISIILISILVLVNNYFIDKINGLKKKFHCLEFLQIPLVTLLLGILSGLIVRLINPDSIIKTIKSTFQEFFMIVLLPPILFASALTMNKFYFFKNLGAIIVLAFFGTFIAIAVNSILLYLSSNISLGSGFSAFESTLFSVLISATDPVSVLISFEGNSCNPNLYALVFGESILNDAITLALYRSLRGDEDSTSDMQVIRKTMKKFIILMLGSCAIAMVVGFVISFIMKRACKQMEALDDQISFKKTIVNTSRLESISYSNSEEDSLSKVKINLIQLNSLVQKKNSLINRQISLMMISPLMAYLIAEVFFCSSNYFLIGPK